MAVDSPLLDNDAPRLALTRTTSDRRLRKLFKTTLTVLQRSLEKWSLRKSTPMSLISGWYYKYTNSRRITIEDRALKEELFLTIAMVSQLEFITELDFEDPGEEALQTRIPNMIDNIGQILGRLAY